MFAVSATAKVPGSKLLNVIMLTSPSVSSPSSCSVNPPSLALVNAKTVSSSGTVSFVILIEPVCSLRNVHSVIAPGTTSTRFSV